MSDRHEAPYAAGADVITIDGPGTVSRCVRNALWGGWAIIVRLRDGRTRPLTPCHVLGIDDTGPWPAWALPSYWVCASCAHYWAHPHERPTRCENCGDSNLRRQASVEAAGEHSQGILDRRAAA